jgi:hypothetical protein
VRLPHLLASAAAALLALPASAAAAPPPNDHYLASSTINRADGTMMRTYRDGVDTSEATTQPDLFNPNREGQPLGGGDPEPTSCPGGTSFGRTAWWDFRPPTAGGVQIKANGGFDVVVAVYTWSGRTSRITSTVVCQNDAAGSEDVLIPEVRKGTNYTIQVGGAGNTGGPLDLSLDWFPDTDADGVFDALDKCRRQKGIERFGGCPPELRAAPRISYAGVSGGIRVTRLAVDDVPKGARAEVRCRSCGRKVVRRATRTGTLRMNGFLGRVLAPGDQIEIRVTLGRTGKGRYRFGAVGKYYRWPIESGKLGRKQTRCLQPGSRKPTKCR